MMLFDQIAAAVLLLSLTLCLQCAGVTTLIEWLKRVLTRDTHKHGPVSIGRVASRHGSSPFTSPRAAIPLWDMVIWFFRPTGDS
jgi:hypothetical protein